MATLAFLASMAMVVVPGSPAQAGEIDLTPFLNNTGIQQDPSGNADFDGNGYSYSAAALRLGDPTEGYAGVTPGQKITAGGFTFTWPNRPAGASDNVAAFGQTIPVPQTPGANALGLLGVSVNGAGVGSFILNYRYTDSNGVEQTEKVEKVVSFTDWTRGLLADAPLEPDNVIVIKSKFRGIAPGAVAPFFFTQPHVFLVPIPLDPSKTLESVELPLSAQIHLFGMAVK
jgi:hypothetical protein